MNKSISIFIILEFVDYDHFQKKLGAWLCRYCIAGDGCNMEGISNEAASLAGHWGLGKLIVFYDDNHISIDGNTEIAFTESVDQRFAALGWHTIWVKDGNTDLGALRAAIEEAKSVTDQPTLIKVSSLSQLMNWSP